MQVQIKGCFGRYSLKQMEKMIIHLGSLFTNQLAQSSLYGERYPIHLYYFESPQPLASLLNTAVSQLAYMVCIANSLCSILILGKSGLYD